MTADGNNKHQMVKVWLLISVSPEAEHKRETCSRIIKLMCLSQSGVRWSALKTIAPTPEIDQQLQDGTEMTWNTREQHMMSHTGSQYVNERSLSVDHVLTQPFHKSLKQGNKHKPQRGWEIPCFCVRYQRKTVLEFPLCCLLMRWRWQALFPAVDWSHVVFGYARVLQRKL